MADVSSSVALLRMENDLFEWESFFQPHILDRGMRYAQSNVIVDLRKDGDKVRATVRGTEYYAVEIDYSGNQVINAYCSCPYACSGEWCKHEAAVLYSLDYGRKPDQGDILAMYEDEPKKEATTEELIAAADRVEIEKLLKELAYKDPKIRSYIRTSLSSGMAKGISKMKKEINDIFLLYSDRGDFINYYNAFEFENHLARWIDNGITELIDNEKYIEAFNVSMYAFKKLGEWDIDDDGEIHSLSNLCYEKWQIIVSRCSEKDKSRIKDWFAEHAYDGTVIDYLEDTLQDFQKYELSSPEELKVIIAELEKEIDRCSESTDCVHVFSSYYGYSMEAINLRNLLAKKIGATETEIEEYLLKHRNFKSVRDHFIKKARENGEVDEEIRLLNDSKKYDKDNKYVLHAYSTRLIELYHAKNDIAHEKGERRADLLINQKATLADLDHYRKMCSKEEWEVERRIIIDSRKSVDNKSEFLADEKMLDELFDLIWRQDKKLALVNKYGVLMADVYYSEILDFYQEHVSELAEGARNRARYNEVVNYLIRMSQYPEGVERAKALCREWIYKYPTRKVMVEELRVWYAAH